MIIGIAGIVLGSLESIIDIAWIGIWLAVASIVGIILVLQNTKHHKFVGVILVVLGVFGNIFFIIPGIMARRYKPKSGSGIITDTTKPISGIEIKCSNCGNVTSSTNSFCPRCGSKLTWV